jgi:HPt (histidine-containing phosphotransfer) domain-containing protein
MTETVDDKVKLMIKIQDLDVADPIDMQTPQKFLGGNVELFYMMLGRLEAMSLTSTMKKIKEAMRTGDYEQMNCGAHTLKGSSGYVGASRIHYACYYI